ncbi:MAG: formylmethanofuran dehydrogenase subunit A [Hyphomicrobiales bacterium]|nr:formylmethanofuran dehydrogenase subunit A [Hyphomicrobiales bacterium]
MIVRISGGHVVDPLSGRNETGDVWIEDGKIVAPPQGQSADAEYDARNCLVMAGAIDIHSHIAGANVATARLMLPEAHAAYMARPAQTQLAAAGWTAEETGRRYARMGFTTVVEPAVSPHLALHAHLELSDIPIIDKAVLAVLGNDDYLLSALRKGEGATAVADYVALTLQATRALGVKCINAGGAMAFKENVRAFSLDDVVPQYGLTSRQIMEALQDAAVKLKLAHPLHLHMNNLGLPGNVETAIATIDAARGLPLHLAHLQFYAYGKEGGRAFSSAAAQLAEKVNASPHVTVDIGQVMFSDTVTISLDVLRQFTGLKTARPRKGFIYDGDINSAGVVPYSYKRSDFFNAVQWACGLELFLLIDDPWRVFFTTDHPNGAPFTVYPEIFALLTSRDRRAEWLASLPKGVAETTTLGSIRREYTFEELAIMTRAAPAKLLGMRDRGSLAAGATADVAVYGLHKDRAKMFAAARYLFKDGALVVRNGEIVHAPYGRTFRATPGFDRAIERRLDRYYTSLYGLKRDLFSVPDFALPRPQAFGEVPCLA